MKNLFLLFFFCFFWVKSFSIQKFFLKDFFWNIKNKSNIFLYNKILFNKYGNWVSEKNINDIIHVLYQIGYFKNIRIYKINNKIFLYLYYKSFIYKIFLKGNNVFKNYEILSFLNKFNIKKNVFLNYHSILEAKNFIIKKYKKVGRYGIKINFWNFFLKKNYCILKINFNEGKYFKIRNFFFKNNYFLINNKFLSFINKNYYYNNILNFSSYFDIKNFILNFNLIKKKYFDYGYLDFSFYKIKFFFLSNNVIDIKVYLHEGKRYKIFDLLIYNYDIKFYNLLNKIKYKFFHENIYYKYDILKNIFWNIKNIFKERGFINININLDYQKISNNKIIIFLYIDSGKIFHINKIFLENIDLYEKKFLYKNNIPKMKNYLYNEYLINLGKYNLKKTNFFTSILLKKKFLNFNKLNIIYFLKKNYDNKLNFGINYGKYNSLNYEFSLFRKNFLYLGNDFFLKSIKNKFSNYNEFYLINPINYLNNIHIKQKIFYNYMYDNKLNNYLNFSCGYKSNILWKINNLFKYKFGIYNIYNNLHIVKNDYSLINYLKSINKNNINNYLLINDFLITNNFTINKLNNIILPKYGYYINLNNKFTFLDSINSFYKTNISWYKYFPITYDYSWIFFLHNYIGYGNGFSGKQLPFYENFNFLENNYLRVFSNNVQINDLNLDINNQSNKIKASLLNNFVGNLAFYFTNELIFPNKYFLNQYYSKYLRTSLFLDSGFIINTDYLNKLNILNNDNNIKHILKISTGVSLKFITSIGTINMSYGFPLLYNSSDKINNFQFNIGNSF